MRYLDDLTFMLDIIHLVQMYVAVWESHSIYFMIGGSRQDDCLPAGHCRLIAVVDRLILGSVYFHPEITREPADNVAVQLVTVRKDMIEKPIR